MFETQNYGNKSDSFIPVISVSVDLPVHKLYTCSEFNQIFIKKKSFKFFKHLNLLHTVYLMTTILSIELIILLFMLWPESLKTGLNVLNAMLIDKIITNQGSQVRVIIVWWYASNNIGLGHSLMRPVFRGCLYSNYTKWFTSGFQIRQGMQQNIIPVPTSKLPFKVQSFADTYFRVFKSFAKIAKIRSSRKFPLIRYILSFITSCLKVMAKVKVFVHATDTNGRAMTLAPQTYLSRLAKTRSDMAFILHMCIPYDKTFHMVP